MIFHARYVSGDPTTSSESKRVQWVPLDEVTDLPMDVSQSKRVRWAVDHPGETYLDPA